MSENFKNQKEVILMTHDAIMVSLRTALYPWLARPRIVPVSFRIEFMKDSWTQPDVKFVISNGRLDSKLLALSRNSLAVLHYAFRVSDSEGDIARGQFKIRVSK